MGQSLRSGVIKFEWVDKRVERLAWDLFQRRAHEPFSLTDRTSFVLMDRLDITDVFTFDRAFDRLERYRLVPDRE